MKILITGGAGFIGSATTRAALLNGHEIVVLDNLSSGLKSNVPAAVRLIDGSVVDAELVKQCVQEVDSVIHLAAVVSVTRSLERPTDTFETNVIGTYNVLEAARDERKYVILASSSAVFGSNPEEMKSDKSWVAPLSPYGASKAALEVLASAYANSYGLPTLVLRLFNVYGPGQRFDVENPAVIPSWLHAADSGQQIRLLGDGQQTRDFFFVEDLAKLLVAAVNTKITFDRPVSVGSGVASSLEDILVWLRENYPNLSISALAERVGDVRNSRADPEILTQLFPNLPQTPFREGMAQTLAWIRDQTGLSRESIHH